jgi:prepilin-type N-terminal cleavage/methylation domain-containing protein
MRRTKMKNNGFTLIELMVVIVVIGIAAGFSIPNLVRTIPVYRLNNATNDIAGQLMIARSKAISDGVPYIGTFTTNGSSFRITKDLNSNNNVDTGEPTVSISLPTDIKTDSTAAKIVFSSRGNADIDGTIRLINNKNMRKRVYVTPSGTVIQG